MRSSFSNTCTLPPLSDMLSPPSSRKNSVLDVRSLCSPLSTPYPTAPVNAPSAPVSPSHQHQYPPQSPNNHHHYHHHHDLHHPYHRSPPTSYQSPLKAKRKRASPAQLSVLNHVFDQTYFPSTELRIELGKQLGMSPRAVQIWFQNKRQSLRTRERQQQEKRRYSTTSVYAHDVRRFSTGNGLPPISPPLSPPHSLPSYSSPASASSASSASSSGSSWHPEDFCPAPPHHECHRQQHRYSLPPLQLPCSPSSPSSSAYPSPTSIDSIILH
ncbi:hypothetical protein BCR43DRAFT_486467 [Syncephalastrum racemosum]|uniref:Homeobox domain-containing protein n=1 Tax=Syncephalastrum racemosum TaxID=13706 RepID=A0A1X2HQI7_SYNRA|nr:hypothetical protein BCR43DRAFT_486467 [Syncephalastrum racemosum]